MLQMVGCSFLPYAILNDCEFLKFVDLCSV
uniref:Uncharacterized protein n=1 Tax=Anguilla anguilla TaxID=7936 RepID=A0A0E9SMS8_ANGAN